LTQYTRVTDGQTDRRTDGRTDGIGVAYTRYSIYAVARNKKRTVWIVLYIGFARFALLMHHIDKTYHTGEHCAKISSNSQDVSGKKHFKAYDVIMY